MIKLEDIIVSTEVDDEVDGFVTFRGKITIACEHRESKKTSSDVLSPDLHEQVEQKMRDSILRHIYGDMVEPIHILGSHARSHAPTHIGVQCHKIMDNLMDIMVGKG